MPKVRTSMRKVREVLRLSKILGLSQRQVARSVRLGQSTVWDYLVRFKVSGLSTSRTLRIDVLTFGISAPFRSRDTQFRGSPQRQRLFHTRFRSIPVTHSDRPGKVTGFNRIQ